MANDRGPEFIFSPPSIGSPYFETEFISKSNYELDEDGTFRIIDAVWGICEIGKEPGDEVLLELLKNPLVCRTMAIEQLTLDPLTETIPGTAEFSRWEHLWGSVAFVRLMTKDLDLDSRARLILQLRTFLSDLAHTAYSHLGDWIFQGVGGPESQHDIELTHLLEVSGINDILRKYDIDPNEVIFPDTSDWIEAPSPELCVDRVDYGAREIRRWLDLSVGIHFAAHPNAFKVTDDGQLVMRSHEDALNFAKAFMLLPTEHWGEPVHRLQLLLKQELVKRVFCSDETALAASNMDGLARYNPRDFMYTIDADITQEMRFREPFLSVLRPLMEDIGLTRRRIFAWHRKEELSKFFFRGDKSDLPQPLNNYKTADVLAVPLVPAGVEITPVDSTEGVPVYKKEDYGVDFLLEPLKARWVDPLYHDASGKICRLSEEDEYYRSLLDQQAEVMRQAYVAKLFLNNATKNIVHDGLKQNQAMWPEALKRPRMDEERFRQLISKMASYALNHRLVELDHNLYLNMPWDA